jgi:hypothetical protein
MLSTSNAEKLSAADEIFGTANTDRCIARCTDVGTQFFGTSTAPVYWTAMKKFYRSLSN